MSRAAFRYDGPGPELARRQILGVPVGAFHAAALRAAGGADPAGAAWEILLGNRLLFDAGGLSLLEGALRGLPDRTGRVEFLLVPDPVAARDFYGLQSGLRPDGTVRLPVEARRRGASADSPLETVRLVLPSSLTPIPFPRSLAEPTETSVPHALLLSRDGDFDLLFASQIAWPAELRRLVPRSPGALLRSLFRREPRDRGLRAATAWREIDRTAEIHPTAVIEGSRIGPGVRVGAHCTVRFSTLAADVRLHDGAKVEFSSVGRGSWLMHDLVLFRCHVEEEVFLIHGPYQFSSFHTRSAAFATILMDWLPHGGAFRVMTDAGLREYRGRFLGSVYREGARTLGGALLAPGRIVPENTWLAGDPDQVHRRIDPGLPQESPVPPGRKDAAAGAPAPSVRPLSSQIP
ncbi:MAG: hypothetical protein HUU15_04070 [Candidatus Brocadiae bacterium]|nr:hypothetical protein [Candidatus Brocadiia bacterium]